MALTVTYVALLTVRITSVIYRMERVLGVNLDGWELHVIQVRQLSRIIFTLLIYLFNLFIQMILDKQIFKSLLNQKR